MVVQHMALLKLESDNHAFYSRTGRFFQQRRVDHRHRSTECVHTETGFTMTLRKFGRYCGHVQRYCADYERCGGYGYPHQ